MRVRECQRYIAAREKLIKQALKAAGGVEDDLAKAEARERGIGKNVFLVTDASAANHTRSFHRVMALSAHLANLAPHPDDFREWCEGMAVAFPPKPIPPEVRARWQARLRELWN